MKKLCVLLLVTLLLATHPVRAADRYQQVFLKEPSQTQTVNLAAGDVAYMFGITSYAPHGSLALVATIDGVSIDVTPIGSSPLVFAGPCSVSFTTAADTHADLAFLWTILTQPNPNIGGVGQ